MRAPTGISRLEMFKAEVTDNGAEACLPHALSTRWLSELAQSTGSMLEGNAADSEGDLALAAVLSILEAKGYMDQFLQSSEDVQAKILADYELELALELMHRCTDIRYEAATLETIFTNRELVTWRHGDTHEADLSDLPRVG
ncbi:hypothetical protein ACO2Q9_10830 [Variovorax sp. VNK109]|jgi:hypothetical protein|uniref:hypothetical protein n=1 Tax=Comamonadaceae TaxID=80864 RepID=UPI000DA664E5|nr:hypothetical protein [Acidovorax sp. ST3]